MLNWVWQIGQIVTSASGCHRGKMISDGLLPSAGRIGGSGSEVREGGPKSLVEVRRRVEGGGDGGVPGRLWRVGDSSPVALRAGPAKGMSGKALSPAGAPAAAPSAGEVASSVRSMTSGSRGPGARVWEVLLSGAWLGPASGDGSRVCCGDDAVRSITMCPVPACAGAFALCRLLMPCSFAKASSCRGDSSSFADVASSSFAGASCTDTSSCSISSSSEEFSWSEPGASERALSTVWVGQSKNRVHSWWWNRGVRNGQIEP